MSFATEKCINTVSYCHCKVYIGVHIEDTVQSFLPHFYFCILFIFYILLWHFYLFCIILAFNALLCLNYCFTVTDLYEVAAVTADNAENCRCRFGPVQSESVYLQCMTMHYVRFISNTLFVYSVTVSAVTVSTSCLFFFVLQPVLWSWVCSLCSFVLLHVVVGALCLILFFPCVSLHISHLCPFPFSVILIARPDKTHLCLI